MTLGVVRSSVMSQVCNSAKNSDENVMFHFHKVVQVRYSCEVTCILVDV